MILLNSKAALCIVVIAFAVPGAAIATTISTGEDLRAVCGDAGRFPECVSFLGTIYKTARMIGRMSEPQVDGLFGSCGPEQGIDTVPLSIAWRLAWQEYAEKHPERLEGLAIEEVLRAYEARWPCKNQN